MTPRYLPGHVLRMSDGNLWEVLVVLPAGDIYTLRAQASGPPVSVSCTGRQLEDMGAVKVAQLPDQLRTTAVTEASEQLDGGADRTATLESLWARAFLAGAAGRADT